MERASETQFVFPSEGESVVGNLFLPERSEPGGVVVAVGPLTSVKEQAAGSYAEAMAEGGYAALAFDYRYAHHPGPIGSAQHREDARPLPPRRTPWFECSFTTVSRPTRSGGGATTPSTRIGVAWA